MSKRSLRYRVALAVAAPLIVAPVAAAASPALASPAEAVVQPSASSAFSHLWVANFAANSLTEYKKNANGDTSPKVTIAGAVTGLNEPVGIALAS